MKRLFLCAGCAILATSICSASATAAAPVEDTYEKAQAKSVGVYDPRRILLPFVKTCEREKTSFRKLFCEALNERLKAQHQGKTYEQTFEPKATGPLTVSFDRGLRRKKRSKPSFELRLRGCITCKKPMLNRKGGDISKARFFVFKQPKTIRVRRGGVFELVDIGLAKVKVPIKVDEDDERPWNKKRFARVIEQHLRTDIIYRPVAGVSRIGPGRFKYGVINFELVGYRVYNKCTGAIYAAQPKMGGKYKVDKNDLTCPQNRPDWGKHKIRLPPKLPEAQVKAAMALVEDDLRACYNQFGKTGTYPVDIVVQGSGRVKSAKVLGKLAGTPTAQCVERMVKNMRLPKFSGRELHVPWPFKIEK